MILLKFKQITSNNIFLQGLIGVGIIIGYNLYQFRFQTLILVEQRELLRQMYYATDKTVLANHWPINPNWSNPKKYFKGVPQKFNSTTFGKLYTPNRKFYFQSFLSVESNKPKSQFSGVAEHVAEDITKKTVLLVA